MKEYLTKNSSGNYQLVNHRFSEDDIEVPDGAEVATASGLAIYFWKPSENKTFINNVGWYVCDTKTICTLDSYLGDVDVSIIWQRHTQPEELPFMDSLNDQYAEIEQVRQATKDNVNHPSHYTQGKVECIDALESATIGKSGIEAVCVANVVKYLWRYEEKNGVEDVKKAQFYLNRLLATLENNNG